MGRLLILLLIIVTVVLLWKAYGPGTWNRNQPRREAPRPLPKGPDDDEEFLWNLEKELFKKRRAEEAERDKRNKKRDQQFRNKDKGSPEEER